MAEIVDPDSGQFRACEDVLECPTHIALIERCSQGTCEHESRVVPSAPSRQPFLELTGPMAFQHPCSHFRQRNGPATPLTLGFYELQLPGDPLERLEDDARSESLMLSSRHLRHLS